MADRSKLNFTMLFEGVTAIAVVLSLIFVGFQMQGNARATRSATAAETIGTVAAWYDTFADNEKLGLLYLQFLRDPESLSEGERYKAVMKLHSLMLIAQNAFYLEQQGTLDTEIRRSLSEPFLAVGSSRGVKYFWEQRRDIFVNEQFIAFVETGMQAPTRNSQEIYDLNSYEAAGDAE